jgi:hypothetical protein
MPFEPVTFRAEPEHYLTIQRRNFPRNLAVTLGVIALIAGGLEYATSCRCRPFDWLSVAIPVGWVLVFVLVIVFAVAPYQLRRRFRETRSFREEVTLVLDEHGFLMEQPSATWRSSWPDIMKWPRQMG